MGEAINDFTDKATNYNVALFYYAGHGIQSHGSNYLIPVNDNMIKKESDIEYYSQNVNRVLRRLEDSGCKLKIIILDACRNNPFERSWHRSVSSAGLVAINAPDGTLIAYATSPGSVAEDGVNAQNSPYTTVFLQTLDKPNLSIFEFFNEVGSMVRLNTENKQTPWFSTSPIEGNFIFNKSTSVESGKSMHQQVQEQKSASLAISSVANKKTYIVNGVSFTMVRVAGGTFTMGSPNRDRNAFDGEKPAHQVTLSDYYIGETEVTQELWLAVMGSNPSHFQGNLQCPVEQVSWNDCQEFIRKLNLLTGATFRLPTEAEWEYAACGGSQSNDYKYSGSNKLSSVAWYEDNSSNTTHPVKGKQPNELGLYDMSGNVYEWCADWYDSSYYTSSPQTNPTGPSSGSYRVIRGGTWSFIARSCRVTDRSYNSPTNACRTDGFRLSLSSFHKVSSSVISAANKINGHEYVDLGLSVKWATCNVGASSPSDYGMYYAWGQTSTECELWEFPKKPKGSIAGKSSYDAARANWGGTWRLPTVDEFEELVKECTWTWTTQDGHNGYRVTGKNGKSIFLPAAGGFYDGDVSGSGKHGYYWSATLYKNKTYIRHAYYLHFNNSYYDWKYNTYILGFTIRPVTE